MRRKRYVYWRRIRLFCGLIGRTNMADYRNGPQLSWWLACWIWDK